MPAESESESKTGREREKGHERKSCACVCACVRVCLYAWKIVKLNRPQEHQKESFLRIVGMSCHVPLPEQVNEPTDSARERESAGMIAREREIERTREQESARAQARAREAKEQGRASERASERETERAREKLGGGESGCASDSLVSRI